jgi:hypothetical protein
MQEPSNSISFFQGSEGNEGTLEIEQEIENEQLEENSQNSQNDEQLEETIEETSLRRSTREIQPSTRLRDFITYMINYSIQNFISYDNISIDHRAYLSSISKEQEPIH